MILSVTPNDKISDYVSGDVKAIVNYTLQINSDDDNCGCAPKPEKETVVVKRNLSGFSGVAHYEKPATPVAPKSTLVTESVTREFTSESANTQLDFVQPHSDNSLRVTEVSTANLVDAYRQGKNG